MADICSKTVISAVLLILLALGVSQISLGITKLHACPTEESLPVWMIVSGVTLVLMSFISFGYALCSWCNLIQGCCCKPNENSPTVRALVCGCTCGFLGVVFLLVWLGIWISGTYLFTMVIKDMRVTGKDGQSYQDLECDLASVILSGVTIALMWTLFLFAVGLLSYWICLVSKKGRTARREKQPNKSWNTSRGHGQHHLYDRVSCT